MNTRMRTVEELEKKRDETKKRLAAIEAMIGHQLLSSVTETAEKESSAGYKKLAAEKEDILAVITEIQTIAAQRSEIKNRLAELKKSGIELESGWEARLEKLGTLLYAHADSLPVASDADIYRIIAAEKGAVGELENQAAAIKTEMETQNLFNRLVTQVRLVTVNNTAAIHKRKLAQQYIKLAKEGFESVLLKDAQTSGSLDEEIRGAYDACLTLRQEIAAQQKRQQTFAEEDAEAKERLVSLGAADNAAKRINELRASFHRCEEAIEELCRKEGHAFANLYITPDGEELLPYSGPLQGFLPDIGSERTQLQSLNRRIEILQIIGAVEETDKKTASLKQSVTENSVKIERLREQNEELGKKLAAVAEVRENLQGRLAELESIEAPGTKLITKA